MSTRYTTAERKVLRKEIKTLWLTGITYRVILDTLQKKGFMGPNGQKLKMNHINGNIYAMGLKKSKTHTRKKRTKTPVTRPLTGIPKRVVAELVTASDLSDKQFRAVMLALTA